MLSLFHTYVLEPWKMIMSTAPVPFFMSLLVIGFAIWFAVNWSYSSVLASKNAQLELVDRQLGDYKQKLSGDSPEQAAKKISELEKQVLSLQQKEDSRAQRSWAPLTPAQIVAWSSKLAKFKI